GVMNNKKLDDCTSVEEIAEFPDGAGVRASPLHRLRRQHPSGRSNQAGDGSVQVGGEAGRSGTGVGAQAVVVGGEPLGGRDVKKNALRFGWCDRPVGGLSCLEGGCGSAERSEQSATSRA